MPPLRSYIWHYLARQILSRSTRDIFRSVRLDYPDVREYEVSRELLALQETGCIRLKASRWEVLKSPPPVEQTVSVTGGDVTGAAVSRIAEKPAPPVEKKAYQGRWKTFRRMVDYYIGCIEQAELPKVSAYRNRLGETWLPVTQRIAWERLESGGSLPLTVKEAYAAFHQNRARTGDDTTCYLGYPVQYIQTRKKDVDFLVPILLQPVRVETIHGHLQLTAEGSLLPNSNWLAKRFRNFDERQSFLRFIEMEQDPESDDGERRNQSSGMAHVASLIGTYFGSDVKEAIAPAQLSNTVDWKRKKPGIYNSCILVLGGKNQFSRSLLRELRTIADDLSDAELDRSALRFVFPHDQPAEEPPEPEKAAAAVVSLQYVNDEQHDAIEKALHMPLTAITGPPGTGKSAVVRALLLNQSLHSRSTLFASKQHGALDAVEQPLNAMCKGPLIIRTAYKDRGLHRAWHETLKAMINRPFEADYEGFQKQKQQLDQLLTAYSQLKQQLRESIRFQQDLEELRTTESRCLQQLPLCDRSEEIIALLQQVAVEIAPSKLMHAIQQLERKPAGLWGCLMRILLYLPRLQATRVLKQSATLLNPVLKRPMPEVQNLAAWKTIVAELQAASELAACRIRIAHMECAVKSVPGRLKQAQAMATLFKQIQAQLKPLLEAISEGAHATLHPEDRQQLSNIRAAVANFGMGRMRKALTDHMPLLLQVFPLWTTTNLSVRSALPLAPGMFDLLVVDEASQCDIASCIPLLLRARRVTAVGDPKQLRHVTGLSRAQEQILLNSNALTDLNLQRFSYLENSFFDVIRSSISTPDAHSYVALCEHFRCHESIAGFASSAFYQNRLIIRTDEGQFNTPKCYKTGIDWMHVDSHPEKPEGGSGSICAEEADAILVALTELQQTDYKGSIGVVTPFKAQAALIRERAYRELDRDFLEQAAFISGTAHAFQGDERDVILFSLCCGPTSAPGSLNFVGKDDNLFNVAITRAKAVLHIFGDMDWAARCGISFVEQCVRHVELRRKRSPEASERMFDSPWEERFYDALFERGIRCIPQYPVAGRFLDLAVVNPIKLDIEVDGAAYHMTAGGTYRDEDIWRDVQLLSMGWKICRFWVHELRDDIDRCVAIVEQQLNGETKEQRTAY